jgi:hypothetical protein
MVEDFTPRMNKANSPRIICATIKEEITNSSQKGTTIQSPKNARKD